MTSMKREENGVPITLGELCEAIALDELPATVEDGYYVVGNGDLKRYTNATSGSLLPMLIELWQREPIAAAS